MPPPAGRDPLLDAILAAAAGATQAARGWLLATAGDQLEVVATHGSAPSTRLGARGPRQFGWAGLVVGTGQPVALAPGPDDPRFLGDLVADPESRPTSLLCFPCPFAGAAMGALQLENKAAGAPFLLDDVELVGFLADVAGAALAERAATGDRGGGDVPAPAELGLRLEELAATDGKRFQAVANVLAELLRER